jgi:probable phosphoglycerate mutase
LKTKTIYLLRHGETDYNKNGMVQGRGVNSSLNANGRTQAEQVFGRLKNSEIDLFYASSLIRTHETLEPFQSEIHKMDGFDEISWGNHEGIVASPEAANLYSETIKKWSRGDLGYNIGGGETPIQVMNRQKPAMKTVLNSKADSVMICMHGRAMKILLCWLLNYPLSYMSGFPHQNCSYYSLKFNGNTFTIVDFNETTHLNG